VSSLIDQRGNRKETNPAIVNLRHSWNWNSDGLRMPPRDARHVASPAEQCLASVRGLECSWTSKARTPTSARKCCLCRPKLFLSSRIRCRIFLSRGQEARLDLLQLFCTRPAGPSRFDGRKRTRNRAASQGSEDIPLAASPCCILPHHCLPCMSVVGPGVLDENRGIRRNGSDCKRVVRWS
jgi:hypothetical protein